MCYTLNGGKQLRKGGADADSRTVTVAAELADDERHLARERADVTELHFRSIWNVEFGLHSKQFLNELGRQLVAQPQEQRVTAVEEKGACATCRRQRIMGAAISGKADGNDRRLGLTVCSKRLLHGLDVGRHGDGAVRRSRDTVFIGKGVQGEEARVHHDEGLADGRGEKAVEQTHSVVRADA